jgi:hypothetical protein
VVLPALQRSFCVRYGSSLYRRTNQCSKSIKNRLLISIAHLLYRYSNCGFMENYFSSGILKIDLLVINLCKAKISKVFMVQTGLASYLQI